MTDTAARSWEGRRTEETREVEKVLREAGFHQVDACRYNSAVIRLRVIDPRFQGKALEKRHAMVEPHLGELPEETQADIVTFLTFAPSELQGENRLCKEALLNLEFEDPSPSEL